MRKLLLISTLILLTSCTASELNSLSFNSTFSTEKVMKLENGMTSDEIVQMFGNPNSVRTAVCGKDHGQAWDCTFWEYGKFGSGYASFTFQKMGGKLLVNSFKVDR